MPPKIYRPPMSDSEDDDGYDGYYFDDCVEKPKRIIEYKRDEELDLYDAVAEGNLEWFKKVLKDFDRSFDVDKPINGVTLLMLACRKNHLDLVFYLLGDCNANPNRPVDSSTALAMALQEKGKNEALTLQIVKALIRYGAVVNVSDKIGISPFMLACENGYKSVVELLIEEVSRDAKDNEGMGPLFYAVENNHPEIVKLLLEKGFPPNDPNIKGYTPLEAAKLHGFDDIVDLFPKQKDQPEVPINYMNYNSWREYIPQIFLKSDCPQYFQEVFFLLKEFHLDRWIPLLAEKKVSLEQFLTLNDEKMKDIGLELEIVQGLIKKVLLCYHLMRSQETKNSQNFQGEDNFYQILASVGENMQEMIIMKSSIKYVLANYKEGLFGKVSGKDLRSLKRSFKNHEKIVSELQKNISYLASFKPKINPLYIDYDEYLKKKRRRKVKQCVQYTSLLLGFSVIFYLKIKNIF